jgi:hypothetical protein
MPSDLTCYALAWIFLIMVLLLCRQLWRSGPLTSGAPKPPRAKRTPQPFAGLTRTPDCALCPQQGRSHPQAPGAPPPRMLLTRGRRRQVNTTGHCYPQATCAYHGWVGLDVL